MREAGTRVELGVIVHEGEHVRVLGRVGRSRDHVEKPIARQPIAQLHARLGVHQRVGDLPQERASAQARVAERGREEEDAPVGG